MRALLISIVLAAGCMGTSRDEVVGVCNGPVTCRAAPPACPQGTEPGTDGICYTGYCIPTVDCNAPGDPGTCAGAVCEIVSPACPTGTVPGVRNGCYTGYCIPNSACVP